MKKLVLAVITLSLFIYWDTLIKLKYIFSRKSIEPWLDRQFHQICRLLFSFTSFFVNVHIHFERPEDIELPDTFMLIANHQSIQDIPLLIWSFPKHDLRFSAKDSLFKWVPTVSVMLRIQKHGRINRRGGAAEMMKTLERVARKSENGYCPVIFPEGTRSKTGDVGVFHQGAVRKMLTVKPLPVVSVAIEGGWRVGTAKDLVKNMENFDYRVKVLRKFDAPSTKQEIQEIIERSAEDISKQVYEWREIDKDKIKTKKGRHIKPY